MESNFSILALAARNHGEMTSKVKEKMTLNLESYT